MTVTAEPMPGQGGSGRPVPGSGPIVTRLRSFTGLAGTPESLHFAVADLPDVRSRLPWQGDLQGFGTSWDDAEHARLSAWGEAVERYCGIWPPDPDQLVHGSYAELNARGLEALPPERLALYSPEQYASPTFPFRPFLGSSPVNWVRATALADGREVHLPAFAVHADWPHVPKEHPEPHYAFPVIGGTAAGATLEDAIRSGLEEVVEHDAATVWWLNGVAQPELPLTGRLAGFRLRPEEIRLWSVGNAFGVPVIAAGVRTPAEGWLTVGTAVRADPEQAALKALAEAYMLQITCRTLDDPRAVAGIEAGFSGRRSPIKPWRAERDYLDLYRADSTDMVELLCHQQLYLDPRAGDAALAWATGGPAGGWAEIPRPPDGSLAALHERVSAAGHEVFYVELTTPEATAEGVRVVRVVVPGTIGSAPAAYPALGGRRVQDLAVRLGWRSEPADESELNLRPMPHG